MVIPGMIFMKHPVRENRIAGVQKKWLFISAAGRKSEQASSPRCKAGASERSGDEKDSEKESFALL
jgi:hypothetical protein